MIRKTKSFYDKVKYPNLSAEYMAGGIGCLDAIKRGANVSREIADDVVHGKDELTLSERISLARYFFLDYSYLFSPSLSLLNGKKHRHIEWFKNLRKDIDRICEYENTSPDIDYKFFGMKKRKEFDEIEELFYLQEKVTYAEYRYWRDEADWCLLHYFPETEKFRTVRLIEF